MSLTTGFCTPGNPPTSHDHCSTLDGRGTGHQPSKESTQCLSSNPA